MDTRPSAVFPLCAHIKRDGAQCASPAMKGMNFCFQHIRGTTSSLLRARATHFKHSDIEFAYPGDRESIQHNLFLVAHALKEGRIDVSIANTYNRIFRTCEQNLHRWEKAQKQKKDQPDSEQPRMAPLSVEADESEASAVSQSSENTGAPYLEEKRDKSDIDPIKPSLSGDETSCRFVSGQGFSPADIGLQKSGALAPENAGAAAPCLEETSEKESTEPDNRSLSPEQKPDDSWELNAKILSKYKNYFLEFEKKYSHLPDYGDRYLAAVVEILDREKAADGGPAPDRSFSIT